MQLLTALLLVATALTDGPGGPGSKAATPPKKEAAAPITQRVAVLGASISAGMGLDPENPMESKLNLSTVIEASVAGAHDPVQQLANVLMFMEPASAGARAVAAAQAKDPTLVVALDYLFWFGYGTKLPKEEDRLALLETGLKSLEVFKCPILLGDFGDMHIALEAKHPVITADAVPAPETLTKLNARLAAWAKDKPNVVIVKLSDLTRKLQTGEEIHVIGNVWEKGVATKLLQEDNLHTTLEGTAALWVCAVEALLKSKTPLGGPPPGVDVRALLKKIDPKQAEKALVKVEALVPKAKPPAKAPAKSLHG